MRPTASALYEGRLTHARLEGPANTFTYGLYMLYLDLDELPSLALGPFFGQEKTRPLSFRRKDYLGGDSGLTLKEAVLREVAAHLGRRPEGPVRLLTQVRSFGYTFNPVSFYYCFAADGKELEAVLAEITNTPWNERYRYVVEARDQKAHGAFPKAFHVSPFQPMEQFYRWDLTAPAADLRVNMVNERQGKPVFQASLIMERKPLTAASLNSAALRYPLMGWKVPFWIYAQALKLWLKRTPFYNHPSKVKNERSVSHVQSH